MNAIITILDYFDMDSTAHLLIGLVLLMLMFPRTHGKRMSALGIVVTALAYTASKLLFDMACAWLEADLSVSFYFYTISLCVFLFLFSMWGIKGDRRQFAMTILYFVNNCVMVTTLARYGGQENGEQTLLNSLAAYALLILVMLAYKAVSQPVRLRISDTYWTVVLLTPLIIMAIWQLSYGRLIGFSFLFLSVLFMVLDFVVYLLFMRLTQELWGQLELELSNQSLAFQIRQMEHIEATLENTRQQRHELKNNYFLIESLLEQGEYDEIRTQLQEVILPQFEVDQLVSTGNHFVDMLLTQKVMDAKQKNIPIALDVLLSEDISLNQQMLCSLLSNLLDNAIEASAKIAEPHIFFYMRQFKGYISIEIRNRIDRSVLETNPNLRTSKDDRDHHGIGMKIIRQIVDHYDGNLKILEENGSFVVTVMLPDFPE